MPDPKLKKISSFLTEFEARAACNRLQDNGIPAYIEGAAGQTALSYIGPAMSGVRLLVDQEHEMLAKQILLEPGARSENIGPWTCGTCFSEVDEGFEVCWKCGSLRSEAEWIAEADEGELRPEKLCYSDESEAGRERQTRTGNNPYETPKSETLRMAADVSAEFQLRQEAIVDRAWKAAILGAVLLPLVTHIYALWCLFAAAQIPAEFSSHAKFRFRMTLLISIVAIFFCTLLLAFNYF